MEAPDGANLIQRGTKAPVRHVPWWRKKCVLFLAACVAAKVVVLLIFFTLLVAGVFDADADDTYAEDQTQEPVDPEFTLSDGRKIVRRSDWISVSPGYRWPLHHPTPYVVIGHTAGALCRGEEECFPLLNAYHDDHRRRWEQPDISYNFLIDVAGNIYEGRGWDATNNHPSWVKRCNIGVSLMGNFMYYNVTQAMTQTLQQLLDLGVSLGKLDPDYRLVAQNQVTATLSPGDNVLHIIDSWPHRCLHDCDVGVRCLDGSAGSLSTKPFRNSETFHP